MSEGGVHQEKAEEWLRKAEKKQKSFQLFGNSKYEDAADYFQKVRTPFDRLFFFFFFFFFCPIKKIIAVLGAVFNSNLFDIYTPNRNRIFTIIIIIVDIPV
jgi:hypothetical protein